MSTKKKIVFAFATVAAFFVLLELGLALVGVRLVLSEDDPYVGFSSYLPLFVETADGDESPQLVTAPNKLSWFNEQRFPCHKAPGTYRIFCLGGSTTYGRPYDDPTSFCGWLRAFLPAADASRRWEVINAGGISYASYRVSRVMAELTDYEPDLFILYCGHNEFLEQRTYPQMLDTPESVRSLGGLLSHTRTYAVLTRLVHSASTDVSAANGQRAILPKDVRTLLDSSVGLDAYQRDDVLWDRVLTHYRFNLDRMVDRARSAHASLILVTPASNLRNCTPFKSEPEQKLDPETRRKNQSLIDRADQAFRANQLAAALAAIDAALVIDNRRADAHYMRGQILLGLERFDEARASLIRARDEDICPLRALSEIESAVRQVAVERDVPLVDFVREINQRSEHGIPGDDWFLDHVHPTIRGNRLLALTLLNALADQEIVHFGSDWNERQIGRVTQAVESRLDPQAQARALRNLSKVLSWAGKHEEADGLALRAVELIPDDSETQYQAGNAWMNRGDRQAATEHYRAAQRLDPESALPYYGLGLVFLEQQDFAHAEQNFQRAVQMDPQFRDAHYNLAVAWEALGDLNQAEQHYLTVHRLSPTDTDVLNNLGILNAKRRRFDDAAAWFQKAVALDPEFSRARANLGLIYQTRGELHQAVETYRATLKHVPWEISAARNLAWILATSEDKTLRHPSEAVQWAHRAAETTDYADPDVLHVLVTACQAAGRSEEAAKWEALLQRKRRDPTDSIVDPDHSP